MLLFLDVKTLFIHPFQSNPIHTVIDKKEGIEDKDMHGKVEDRDMRGKIKVDKGGKTKCVSIYLI